MGLRFLIAGISGISSAALVALIFFESRVEAFVGAKSYTELVRFFLFVLIGGMISILYKKLEHGRERRTTDRRLIQEFHDALVHAYNDVKKVRRTLRARAISHDSHAPDYGVKRKEY